MIGKITITNERNPVEGEMVVHFVFEDNYKRDRIIQQSLPLLKKLQAFEFKGKDGEMVTTDTMIVVGAGKIKKFNLVKWREILTNAFRYCQTNKITSVTVSYFEQLGKDYPEIGKTLAIALYLTNYNFDFYKGEEAKKKLKRIENVNFQFAPLRPSGFEGRAISEGVEYGKLLSEGIYLTRDMVNQPASHTHPQTMVDEALKICKESKGKITVKVLDEDECQRLGMGSFLGVAKGSVEKPKFIILHHEGKGKKICLIGKSITFDSGGLSLKPSEAMETMKMDMAGGATVLGIFKILSQLEADERKGINADIYGILPACENMPSGHALRPGDIVSALNKKTIEVLNTDAEGRLALADAISYSEKYLKPDMIIDIATLTGACMVALGKDIAGMFGNDEKTNDTFTKAAKSEGEELWPLPLHKAYAKSLKSPVADLKNVGGGHYGGAITAALFLSEFVKKAKWIHLDIAGPAFNEDGGGATGWGVMSLLRFVKSF